MPKLPLMIAAALALVAGPANASRTLAGPAAAPGAASGFAAASPDRPTTLEAAPVNRYGGFGGGDDAAAFGPIASVATPSGRRLLDGGADVADTHAAADKAADGASTVAPLRPAHLPEPATWAMMILGFAAAGAGVRRAVRRSNARFEARIRRIAAGEDV